MVDEAAKCHKRHGLKITSSIPPIPLGIAKSSPLPVPPFSAHPPGACSPLNPRAHASLPPDREARAACRAVSAHGSLQPPSADAAVSPPIYRFRAPLNIGPHGAEVVRHSSITLAAGRNGSTSKLRGDADLPSEEPSVSFYGHELELSQNPDRLFEFFRGSVRQNTQRRSEVASLSR